MADFQVDVDDLKAFADTLRNRIIGNGTSPSSDALTGQAVTGPLGVVAPGKLDLGQGYGVDFQAAVDLSNLYANQHDGWVDSYHKLLNSLETLAEVADQLAKNYQDAQDADALSAKSVDDAFDNAPKPNVAVPGSTPTTTTTGAS